MSRGEELVDKVHLAPRIICLFRLHPNYQIHLLQEIRLISSIFEEQRFLKYKKQKH